MGAATVCTRIRVRGRFAKNEMTAMELYLASVKQLPAVERLRLALLILRDIKPADLVKGRDHRKADDLQDSAIKLVDGPSSNGKI
jgi:hypothetical protein